jgi:hypothetical protein
VSRERVHPSTKSGFRITGLERLGGCLPERGTGGEEQVLAMALPIRSRLAGSLGHLGTDLISELLILWWIPKPLLIQWRHLREF